MTNNYKIPFISNDDDDEDNVDLQTPSLQISVKSSTKNTFRVYVDGAIGPISQFRSLIDILHSAGPEDVIEFMMASPGGQADTMIAIINAIKSTEAQTIAVLIGFNASAATAIILACDNVLVMPHSSFMVHNASYGVPRSGSNTVKRFVQFSEKQLKRVFVDCYEGFLTEEEISKLFEDDKEMWMDEDEIAERLNNRNQYFREKAAEQEQQEQEAVDRQEEQE